MSVESDNVRLSVIEQDLKYIREFIEEDRRAYKDHLLTAQHYRDRVAALEHQQKAFERAFDTHCLWDRWLFGTIITVGLGILLKLFA